MSSLAVCTAVTTAVTAERCRRAAGGPRAEPPRLGRGCSMLGHRRHVDLAVAPKVMQVELRRCAARHELAAAARRRSEELVSRNRQDQQNDFLEIVDTRPPAAHRRDATAPVREEQDPSTPGGLRSVPELWSTTLPSDIRPSAPALA